MTIVQHFFTAGTSQHQGRIFCSEALFLPVNSTNDFLSRYQSVFDGLHFFEAHIAGGTILGFEVLSKVFHQHAMPTDGAGTVGLHLHQLFQRCLSVVFVFGLINQKFPRPDISTGVHQITFCFQAVSTRSAAFLLIGFDTGRHFCVNHIAHIAFVDPHSKGNGGDNNVYFFIDEHFLMTSPLIGFEARMICQCVVAKCF